MVDNAERSWVEGMAAAYEAGLVPTVFAPFADDLARRIVELAPSRVLELGAGTGALTRALLERTDAAITATDFSDSMVDIGRANAPGARWQQADATKLAFADASFDVIAAQFSVMFFPDKAAAFAQVRRCLAPEGAFMFSTWGPLEEHDFQSAVVKGLSVVFGGDAPGFMAAVPHGYHDVATIEADLRAAGLALRNVQRVELVRRAPSALDLARGYCLGTPIHTAVAERGASLDEVIAEVGTALHARLGDPLEGRMVALVFTATIDM